MANGYLTVAGKRSRYLGPDGGGNPALSSAGSNLASDLHFQRIKDSGVVEGLIARPEPRGPRPEVREIIGGYVDGYNRYLRDTGTAGITDPACHGAAWLRPITDLDVYRHFYAIVTAAGQGAMVDDLVGVGPPTADGPGRPAADADPVGSGPTPRPAATDLGSNGIAVGRDGTASGGGVLLGNPHYPWRGGRRFWQAQLTIPGRFNVSGASLLGIPLVQIGHTDDVAWTHTVATPRTFGLFEMTLMPGDPTVTWSTARRSG